MELGPQGNHWIMTISKGRVRTRIADPGIFVVSIKNPDSEDGLGPDPVIITFFYYFVREVVF